VNRPQLHGQSVLTMFLSKCYSAIPGTILVYLNLIDEESLMSQDIEVSEEKLETLIDVLGHQSIGQITFKFNKTFESVQRSITGTVNLYMLVFGSMDWNLLDCYSGVRFIWGPSQCEKLIGREMMKQLMFNERFRTISIFRSDDESYDQLKKFDTHFQKIIITNPEKEEEVYCLLNDTKDNIFQTYLANIKSFISVSQIELTPSGQNNHFFFNSSSLNIKKRKRVAKQPPNKKPERLHPYIIRSQIRAAKRLSLKK